MTTPDRLEWRKSSYSSNGENCVEIAFSGDTVVIRDSKYRRDPANDPAREPIITLPAAAWPIFLDLVARSGTSDSRIALRVRYAPDGGVTLIGRSGTTLTYTAAEWEAFTAGVRDGEFAMARLCR